MWAHHTHDTSGKVKSCYRLGCYLIIRGVYEVPYPFSPQYTLDYFLTKTIAYTFQNTTFLIDWTFHGMSLVNFQKLKRKGNHATCPLTLSFLLKTVV